MEIIVQGNGREYFKPNEVILNLNFYKNAKSYEEALSKGIRGVQRFVSELLLENGFTSDDMKTRSFVVKKEEKYDTIRKKYVFDGFSFQQGATLKFDYEKEKLAKIMEELSNLVDAPACRIDFGVKEEKECRKRILAKAFKDAELQAQAIAEAAGKTLKQCMKVDFKPFTTTYVSKSILGSDMVACKSACIGAASSIVNTFTPEDIELSETLYCLWITE